MISRIRFWAGLVCAMIAAIWWAVGITVIQPLVEPVASAENNTYWLRDTRWLALLAIVLAFVWSFRGDKRLSGMAAGALVVGFGADIALDRFDDVFMTEQFDFVESNSIRWGVYLVVILVPGAWIRAKFQPVRPNRKVSTLAAFVAAAAAAAAAAIESPTDTEWGLYVAGIGLGLVLTVVACGNAVEAAGRLTVQAMVIIAVAGAVAAVLLVGGRLLWPGPESASTSQASMLALLFVEVATVLLLATVGRWQLGPRLGMSVAIAIVTFFAGLIAFVAMDSSGLVAGLTALAGNPAVNRADSDVSYAVLSGLVGLASTACLLLVDRGFVEDKNSRDIVEELA